MATDRDVKEALATAQVYAALLLRLASELETAAPEFRATYVRMIHAVLRPREDPALQARMALLDDIDAVVAERTIGTGLGELVRQHFPELGGPADLATLANPESPAYFAFAEAVLHWRYRYDLDSAHRTDTPATAVVLLRTAVSGNMCRVGNLKPPVRPPLVVSTEQAAFVVCALFFVAQPARGALLLRRLDAVAAAIDRWGHRDRLRWKTASALVEIIGAPSPPTSLRVTWGRRHASRRRLSASLAAQFA